MAIITLNNNSLSSVTSLPAAISTGKVLQVSSIVQGATNQNIATTTYTDLTNMSINITPASTSSKILVVAFVYARLQDAEGFGVQILRDTTDIYATPTYSILADANPLHELYTGGGFQYIDSPSSTSQLTYKLQAATHDNLSVAFNPSVASYMYLVELSS